MPSAMSWTLVALASLLVGSQSVPTYTPDLVTTTGIPVVPTGPPTTPVEPNPSDDVAAEATEGPMPPLKVSSMNVTSVIALRYAHTTVLTRMKNPAKISQEATFSIVLPETAFITGFVMTLDGTPYAAYVREKEEAKNIYTHAVSQGLGAAHIAAKARDSNHFTVSVNIEPSTEALFNLTYEELLTRRLEVYNHVVNLNPGRLVPDLTVNIFIKEGRKITTLRVPELRTGNEVDAQESDRANEFAKIERNSDNTEAYIKFAPNLEQQEALMQVYAEKSKNSAASQSNGYYTWNRPTEAPSTEGMLGQFVVQYDVERDPDNGEIMVNDGYFVHFFSPSSLKPLKKHVIFVLDTSSSMMGRKIEQLKEAMTSILSELKPGDYFNIVEFNSYAQIFNLENLKMHQRHRPRYHYYYDEEENPTASDTIMPPPSPATPNNINRAKEVIENLHATGVTNIYDALDLAVKLAKAGLSKINVTSANLPELSDTNLVSKDDVKSTVNAGPENQKPEPIIIFLTDGQPTTGIMNEEKILGHVSELNSEPNQTPIYSLAFGTGADRNFLRELSLRNSGFLRHIYEAADAAQQLQHFYSQVADPLLSNVRFTYPADQIDEASITKHNFRTLFSGAELVIAGKLINKDVEQITPAVTAICSVGPIDFNPKPSRTVRADKIFRPLERLWVYLHIKQLLDQKDASGRAIQGENPSTVNKKKPEKEALELALQYSFVTPLTSLVVVKPNDTAAVNAESVDNAKTYGVPGTFVGHSFSRSGGSRRGGSSNHVYSSSRHSSSAQSSSGYSSRGYSGHSVASSSIIAAPQRASQHRISYDSADRIYDRSDRISGGDAFGLRNHAYVAPALLPENTMSLNRMYVGAGPHGYPGPLMQPDDYGYTSSFHRRPTHGWHHRAPQTTSAKPPSKLHEYNLLEFQWLEQYLDTASDSVNLPVNGTTVNLKLFKGVSPTFTSEETTCADSLTAGSAGTCKYLTECAAAKNIASLNVFLQHRCEREGYAAVCCPAQS